MSKILTQFHVWYVFGLWRARRVLENRQNMDDDKMGRMEISLKEAQATATEADKQYEEVIIN